MEVLKIAIGGLFMSQQQQMAEATSEANKTKNTAENVLKLKVACKTHAEQSDDRFTWIHKNVKPTMVAIFQVITPGMVAM